MKKILLLAIIPGILMSSCRVLHSVSFNEDEFVKTYDISGSKNELYIRANSWMISTFNNAESVIQFSDKEEGIVIGKYLLHQTLSTSTNLYAIIDIRVKDNKARFQIKPPNYTYAEQSPNPYTKEWAINDMAVLELSFREAIHKPSVDF